MVMEIKPRTNILSAFFYFTDLEKEDTTNESRVDNYCPR